MFPTPHSIVRLAVLGLGRLPHHPVPLGMLPVTQPSHPPLLSPFALMFPLLLQASDNFPVQKAGGTYKVPQPYACSSIFNSQRGDLCIKQTGMIPIRAASWVSQVILALDTLGDFLLSNQLPLLPAVQPFQSGTPSPAAGASPAQDSPARCHPVGYDLWPECRKSEEIRMMGNGI